MNLATLPTEILLQVATLLPLDSRITLLHVSHRFKQITSDPSLWSIISITRDFSHSNAYISQLYQRDRLVVESRFVSSCPFDESRNNDEIGRKQINSLNHVVGCLLGTVVPAVGPVGVKELNVRGLADKFTDSHLMQIARWCPHLVSCNVSGTSVTDKGVQYLFGSVTTYQKSMEALRDGVSRSRHTSTAPIKGIDGISSVGSIPPPPPPPLMHPDENDFTIREYYSSGGDEKHTLYRGSNANEMELRERQIVDTITNRLALLLPSAYGIIQHDTPSPTSTTTTATSTTTESVSPRCPNIQHLYLSGSKPITDTTVAKIAQNAIFLKTLDLTSFTSSSRVSDAGIVLVSKHCLGLETLMMSGCSQITDDSLMYLGGWEKTMDEKPGRRSNIRDVWKPRAEKTGWKSRLKRLEMSGCFQVTDFGVSAIFIGCADLEILDLGYCWRVTDASFVLSEDSFLLDQRLMFWKDYQANKIQCVGLKVLSLRFCYLVTDAGVSRLFREDLETGGLVLSQLSRVDVTSCQRVTRRSENGVLYWEESDEFERDLQ
ncbi:hypothetical protein BDR26DRAFT_934976 [Obelidium mucronatum]|nr:hypothetical protein BDR26DRAFT_934976 [Obelidium mucronatum]